MICIHHNHYSGYDDQGSYDIEQGYVLAENQGAPHHAPDDGYSFIGIGHGYGQVLDHLLPEDGVDEQGKEEQTVEQKEFKGKEFLVCCIL